MKKIHSSQLRHLIERRDANNRPIPFDLQFCKRKTGELVDLKSVVLTSWHSSGGTINVIEAEADKPRKIRRCLITRINDYQIYH